MNFYEMNQILENAPTQQFGQLSDGWWVNYDGNPLCPSCWEKYISRFIDADEYYLINDLYGTRKKISKEAAQQPLPKGEKLLVMNQKQMVLKSCQPLQKHFMENPRLYETSDGLFAQCMGNESVDPDCVQEIFVNK